MKKYFPILLLLGCAAALVLGLVELFQLRFEVGDVYPAYSSLRSDPLGTMVFYESLGKVPGVSARRDFSVANRLPEEPHTVYLHLAASRYEWQRMPKDLYGEIEGFLGRGGRLVVTFFPQTESYAFHDEDDDETNSVKSAQSRAKKEKMTPEKPAKKRKKKADDEEVRLDERWGLHTDFQKLAQAGDVYVPVPVVNRTDLPLPRTLEWHSGTVFINLDGAWRVIYARDTNAVVIERRFGMGSIIFATDSYFVSNEAMARDRHPDLLAWLVGPNPNVVFDEGHLGVLETPGVAALMRQYRLHGLLAGLILLAGLFIWKNSLSLAPPHRDREQRIYVAGKDAASGFINLLRRSIAPRDLLGTCFAQWKKSAGFHARPASARVQQAEAIWAAEASRPPKDRQPVETYKQICSVLGTRNSPPKS